jgi:hypothetical protein
LVGLTPEVNFTKLFPYYYYSVCLFYAELMQLSKAKMFFFSLITKEVKTKFGNLVKIPTENGINSLAAKTYKIV